LIEERQLFKHQTPIGRRKPDGVYPDHATAAPPVLYLEIKDVRYVSDDIHKSLNELAEASLEMNNIGLREAIRRQIRDSPPVVVGLFLSSPLPRGARR
jgi:hypothetical protein